MRDIFSPDIRRDLRSMSLRRHILRPRGCHRAAQMANVSWQYWPLPRLHILPRRISAALEPYYFSFLYCHFILAADFALASRILSHIGHGHGVMRYTSHCWYGTAPRHKIALQQMVSIVRSAARLLLMGRVFRSATVQCAIKCVMFSSSHRTAGREFHILLHSGVLFLAAQKP